MSGDLLRVDNLHASYGSMRIVEDLSLHVDEGERVAVLGRNGAGKTTTLMAISGALPGNCGCTMWIRGEQLRRHTPEHVMKAGIAVVPEGHQVFPDLSVRENLRLGAFHRRRGGAPAIRASLDMVFDLFPLLGRDQQRQAGQLSGGGQQMVAVGQALLSEPVCLLLDEPSSGLAPVVTDDIYAVLDVLCENGTAVVVVEQNVERALAWSERCYVMDRGAIAIEGRSRDLASSGAVDRLVRGIEAGAVPPEPVQSSEAVSDTS